MLNEVSKLETARLEERNDILLRQRDALLVDLEKALNLCRQYQRYISMHGINDPTFVETRGLLTKYRMKFEHPNPIGKVYADGQDITEHPDSIEGTTIEVKELGPVDTRRIEVHDDDGETD